MQFDNITELKKFLPYGSIRKIAANVGVSYTLVSRIMNEEKGLRVSNETVAAVVREAKKLATVEKGHIDKINDLSIK
jgi:AraC-like DNA-binding protein